MSWISKFYGYWDYWQLYHKVTFDGSNKLILVTPGVTELNVKEDIFSDWKEWLVSNHDGLFPAKFVEAIQGIGGQPLPGNRFLGSTFFLVNGWRIKPYEGSYTLTINGNLYTEEGDSPFIDADGLLNNIKIVQTVSTLVETVGITTVESAQSLDDIKEAVWQTILENYESTGNAAEAVEKIKRNIALLPAVV